MQITYLILTLLAFLLYVGFSFLMGYHVVQGLKTGKIAHTDGRQFADRRKQPLFFWFLIFLFTGFMLMPIVLFGNRFISVLASAVSFF